MQWNTPQLRGRSTSRDGDWLIITKPHLLRREDTIITISSHKMCYVHWHRYDFTFVWLIPLLSPCLGGGIWKAYHSLPKVGLILSLCFHFSALCVWGTLKLWWVGLHSRGLTPFSRTVWVLPDWGVSLSSHSGGRGLWGNSLGFRQRNAIQIGLTISHTPLISCDLSLTLLNVLFERWLHESVMDFRLTAWP